VSLAPDDRRRGSAGRGGCPPAGPPGGSPRPRGSPAPPPPRRRARGPPPVPRWRSGPAWLRPASAPESTSSRATLPAAPGRANGTVTGGPGGPPEGGAATWATMVAPGAGRRAPGAGRRAPGAGVAGPDGTAVAISDSAVGGSVVGWREATGAGRSPSARTRRRTVSRWGARRAPRSGSLTPRTLSPARSASPSCVSPAAKRCRRRSAPNDSGDARPDPIALPPVRPRCDAPVPDARRRTVTNFSPAAGIYLQARA
jgi:hypothetical protein